VFDQRANEDEALRKWKVALEQYERMLAQANCNYALPHVRRWIEEKQHLQIKIAELEAKRAREDAIPVSNEEAPEPDSVANEKGKRCHEIVAEIRKIRNMADGFQRTVSQIGTDNPGFQVWSLVAHLSDEDREIFNHPRQWGPVVGYARNLLGKDYSCKPDTIRKWITKYRAANPEKRVKRPIRKKSRKQA
jgi:hypothetical protein